MVDLGETIEDPETNAVAENMLWSRRDDVYLHPRVEVNEVASERGDPCRMAVAMSRAIVRENEWPLHGVVIKRSEAEHTPASSPPTTVPPPDSAR